MSTGCTSRFIAITAVAIGLAAARANADAAALAKRLPSGANVVAYIDVDSILNSKLGVKEGWRAKLKETYASTPFIVPAQAKEVLMASWIEPTCLAPVWEVSLIDLATTPSLDRIARDAKGFTEQFGSKLAAWTPTNAYFIRLDSKLLGVVSPSDRQFAARWSAHNAGSADHLSPYLHAAVNKLEPKTDFLFAFDLGDMISEKRFRRRLAQDEIECLAGKEFDVNKFCDVMGSAKGLKLVVQVGEDINGNCSVDFGHPVADLGAHAKPLLLEILDKAGVGISDFSEWKATPKGNSIVLNGSLSIDGFRRLLSIVDPPSPHEIDEQPSSSSDSANPAPASPAVVAEASRKYFKGVAEILDGIGKEVSTANALTKGAQFVGRDARRISRLPLLNVDPELAQWGTGVSSRLTQVATNLGVGGFNAQSAALNVGETWVNDNVNDYTYGIRRVDPNDDVNRRNTNRQRRAAVADAKANTLKEISQVLQDIETSRAAIRATMTQRHKVEF